MRVAIRKSGKRAHNKRMQADLLKRYALSSAADAERYRISDTYKRLNSDT
jgi:hypothetical protein